MLCQGAIFQFPNAPAPLATPFSLWYNHERHERHAHTGTQVHRYTGTQACYTVCSPSMSDSTSHGLMSSYASAVFSAPYSPAPNAAASTTR